MNRLATITKRACANVVIMTSRSVRGAFVIGAWAEVQGANGGPERF